MFEGMVLPGKGMGWKEFFKNVKEEWTRDKVGDVAGALTFFSVLALFPFLLFLISLMSVVIDPHDAQVIVGQLGRVAPGAVTEILGERIKALGAQSNIGLLTFGAVAAFVSASSGVVALIAALNTVYGVEESRPFWKVRGLAFLITIAGAIIGVLAALIAVATPAVAEAIGGPIGTAITWLRLPIAGLMMMLVWALIYYFLPDVEQRFKFITPGSIVGVVLWVLASYGFSFYVTHFGKYDATYGTVGGVIVMLLWMWISAQVLLLGAEINAIVEHKSPEGKGAGAKTEGEPAANATKSEVEDRGGAVPASAPGAPLDERVAMARRKTGGSPAGPWWQRARDLALGGLLVGALVRWRRRA